jgi:ribonuclease HI
VAQKKFYVVWAGRKTGIYTDWASCKDQVDGFAGARYKSFPTRTEAEAAFSGGSGASRSTTTSTTTKASNGKRPSNRQTVKTYDATEIASLKFDTFIYTDGGCEPNPGEAGSGMAVYRGGEISELWYGLYNPKGTNNTAELHALFQALLLAEDELVKKRTVVILCDSKYSIQCITQWAAGWKKKGWKKAGGEIKNLELIQDMYALYEGIRLHVQLLHVNGHVGVEGNELADRMSIMAIAEQNSDFDRYSKTIDIKEILALRAG